MATQGKININTAPIEDLRVIPGVGKVKAERIVRFRERYGKVTRDDLGLILGDLPKEVIAMIDFKMPIPLHSSTMTLPEVPRSKPMQLPDINAARMREEIEALRAKVDDVLHSSSRSVAQYITKDEINTSRSRSRDVRTPVRLQSHESSLDRTFRKMKETEERLKFIQDQVKDREQDEVMGRYQNVTRHQTQDEEKYFRQSLPKYNSSLRPRHSNRSYANRSPSPSPSIYRKPVRRSISPEPEMHYTRRRTPSPRLPSRRHVFRSPEYMAAHNVPARGDPKHMPKNLKYDGSSNWLSFRQKFDSYRDVMRWTDSESRDYLIWSLEGKALNFFAVTAKLNECSFSDLIRKLEYRFGEKQLVETARVKFQQAHQKQDESLEDWSDRVLTLASTAFRDLPESYSAKEAIARFCQGCWDKDAGKHACFEHPRDMQEALDAVRYHQYISQAVDGKKKEGSTRKNREEYSVNMVKDTGLTESKVEQMLAKAIENLTLKIAKASEGSSSGGKGGQGSINCYFCTQPGHLKRDCALYLKWRAKKDAAKAAKESPLN